MMPVIMNSSTMLPEASYGRTKTPSLFIATHESKRPISIATTEILDTDFEDDNSDFEESQELREDEGLVESHNNTRRRSQLTVSSFDEITTPLSSGSQPGFDLSTIRPAVEGPRGPHLFRSSQISAEFAFDDALQLSPLQPKDQAFLLESALAEYAQVPTIQADDVARADEDYESELRQWSTQEVLDWMYTSGLDASVIDCLELHDVNGNVLLDLDFDDLRDLDIVSFGKRHQLWSAISALRCAQTSLASPVPTTFQDISRPCTANQSNTQSRSRQNSTSASDDGISPKTSTDRRRRGRKASKGADIVTPAESVSIVAIEQLLPKPHTCAKGERCAKWRKQQRELDQLQAEAGGVGRFPVSPTQGGRIHIYGDPGNASTAENIIPNVRIQQDFPGPYRPQSEGLPSVVASSDLLGPGQSPLLALDSEALRHIAHRDPHDNVLQFLNYQHLHPNSAEAADSPIHDPVSRSQSVPPLFPYQHHQAYPSLSEQNVATPPHQGLRNLPKLSIPRASSAAPDAMRRTSVDNEPLTAFTICRSATASPEPIYRFETPATDMDVPVTAIPVSPYPRDASQSVPPNMQYRQQSLARSNSRRGPNDRWRQGNFLPAVIESEPFTEQERPLVNRPSEDQTSRSSSLDKVRDPAHHSPTVQKFGYGEECTYAGWMKKRKTKILRHEWQDAHFRLKGTQLAMHSNARLSAAVVDVINVDNYSVACSSTASNSKLSAAMKAFHIKNSVSETKKSPNGDSTAFAFQLVPSQDREGRSRSLSSSKTHHFAVKTKDERIDWMRELMLAKALQQKGKGYDVEINGVHA